jgi:hypothetical protein
MENASIINVLGHYPGLTWKDLASPAYATPEAIPVYVTAANKLIMGTGGTPTIPLFIGQGANGVPEGTPGNKRDIGAGDGGRDFIGRSFLRIGLDENPQKQQPQVTGCQRCPQVAESWKRGGEDLHTTTFSP